MDPGGNGSGSTRGRQQRLRANSEKRLVYPTPANQEIYNRYRNRLEQAKLRTLLSPPSNPTLLSPGVPSDGGSLYEDDARSTPDMSDGDDYVNAYQPSLEVNSIAATSALAAGGRRTRGRRRQPLSKEAKFEAAVVRKLNLACAAHRRRRVKCTCNDLSLFEEAWEHSRAPAASHQPNLAPRQRTGPPATEDYLGDFQQNEPVPGPHVPQFQIFDPDGIDLAADAVPRASTTNFLSQFQESLLPSRPIMSPVDSDNSMPLWGAGSWTDTSHESCAEDVVAVEHGDRHGYWWVCRFCDTSLDTIKMARDHYKESHLQPPWAEDRIYRLQCTSCRTTREVYDFSVEPPREFCPASPEQFHAWQLLASINTTTYSATGSEAITGIDSGFSRFFPPSSVSSNPPLFMEPDDGRHHQLYQYLGRYTGDYTWQQQVIHVCGNTRAKVVTVGSDNNTNNTGATYLLLSPKYFQPDGSNDYRSCWSQSSMGINHDQCIHASRFPPLACSTINDLARPPCRIIAGMAETIFSLAVTAIMIVAAIIKLRRPGLVNARAARPTAIMIVAAIIKLRRPGLVNARAARPTATV